MKNLIKNKIKTAQSLKEIKEGLFNTFDEIRISEKFNRIGYVSGIISSDGHEYVVRNMNILQESTEKLRNDYNFSIFSATDVFDDEVFSRIDAHNLPYEEWIYFWRDILKAGYITDVFMTQRWEQSKGAIDEYETAEKLGLRIHILSASALNKDL